MRPSQLQSFSTCATGYAVVLPQAADAVFDVGALPRASAIEQNITEWAQLFD